MDYCGVFGQSMSQHSCIGYEGSPYGSETSHHVTPQVFAKMLTPSSWHGTHSTIPNYCCEHQTPIQSSLQDGINYLSEHYLEGTPQHYGFHNLNRRSVFLIDGSEHSYYVLPENYSLEQATSSTSPAMATVEVSNNCQYSILPMNDLVAEKQTYPGQETLTILDMLDQVKAKLETISEGFENLKQSCKRISFDTKKKVASVTNILSQDTCAQEQLPKETGETSTYFSKAPENKTHSPRSPKYATATDQMQFQTSETLPVFDVYDDKMDGCSSEFVDVLVGIPDQQRYEEDQQDSEQSRKCSKANNTVVSESLFVHVVQPPTDVQDDPIGHKVSYVSVEVSIECRRNNKTELPSLPNSELCGEQRKPQHGNNQQRNLLLAEMRREVWDPGTSTSLHSSMANLCNQGGTYGREVWDPGDTNLHVLFMTADGATELQCTDADQSAMVPILAMHFGEKRATISEATMASQDSPASSTPILMHVDDMQLSTSVQVAPGLFEEIPVYDDYEEDGNGSLNFFVELCDIGGQQKQYNSEKPIYDHEEPHCAAKLESDNELLAVCFNNTSDNAFSQEGTYFRFPHGPLIHDVRSIELTKEKSTQAVSILYVQEATVHCDDWRSEINIKKQEVLINKHDMVYPCDLNTDKVPLSSGPCICDPGIDLFSYKKLYHFIWIPLSAIPLIHQLHTKNFCSWWDFSLKKGRQVQWDPGIKLFLYELLWLQTLSKGTEYAMRLLLVVKFDTQIDTTANLCCPPHMYFSKQEMLQQCFIFGDQYSMLCPIAKFFRDSLQ